MGWIKERLKQEIEKSREKLGRMPKVSCFAHNCVTGVIEELHEDGFIMRQACRSMDGLEAGDRVRTVSMAPSTLVGSDRVFHVLGSGVWWVVEEQEAPKIVAPPAGLVVPR